MNTNLFQQIREVVKRIPPGKVVTYGEVAFVVGINDSRKVGWALHGNQNPEIACHRVVKKNGFLAENYSLGGWAGQRDRLLAEGITFVKDFQVDMQKHHFQLYSV